MAREIVDFLRYTAPDSTYPYGQIKDNTAGMNDGTPVSVLTNGDIQQFFAKMLADSGISANNLADNFDNGWQLWQSNLNAISSNVAQVLILMIGSGYDTATGYVLSGLTSAFQDGFMLFDGKIYYVEAYGGGGGAPYGINRGLLGGATQDTYLRAYVDSDATPNMCLFADLVYFNSDVTIDPADFNSGWNGTPLVPCTYSIDTNGYVHWSGQIQTSGGSGNTIWPIGGIPAEARPLVTKINHICMSTAGGGGFGALADNFVSWIEVWGNGKIELKGAPTSFGTGSGDFLDITGLSYKVR